MIANSLQQTVLSAGNTTAAASVDVSTLHIVAMIAIPAAFGLLAISLVAQAYFGAIAKQPDISEDASARLLVVLGLMELPVFICIGIGYQALQAVLNL